MRYANHDGGGWGQFVSLRRSAHAVDTAQQIKSSEGMVSERIPGRPCGHVFCPAIDLANAQRSLGDVSLVVCKDLERAATVVMKCSAGMQIRLRFV